MKLRKLTNFFILIILIPTFLVEGQVYVRGYYRSDGVYVRPHYRTYPDGIPYNNYSFPGNYNPNTGEITPGDPLKYLEKYNTNLRIIPEPLKLPEPSILEIKLSEPSILKKYYPNNYFNKTSKIKFKKLIYTTTKQEDILIIDGDEAKDIIIIDGDTFEYNGERFRIYGYNAPELDEPGGLLAKMVLSLILLNSNTITIKRIAKDKYGRTIAKVFVYGTDIVELLK
jgi:hypothetical protein